MAISPAASPFGKASIPLRPLVPPAQTCRRDNPRQTGYGCSIGTIDLDVTTSSPESTGMPTDCFIQGDGFFLVGPKDVDVNNAEDAKALSLS